MVYQSVPFTVQPYHGSRVLGYSRLGLSISIPGDQSTEALQLNASGCTRRRPAALCAIHANFVRLRPQGTAVPRNSEACPQLLAMDDSAEAAPLVTEGEAPPVELAPAEAADEPEMESVSFDPAASPSSEEGSPAPAQSGMSKDLEAKLLDATSDVDTPFATGTVMALRSALGTQSEEEISAVRKRADDAAAPSSCALCGARLGPPLRRSPPLRAHRRWFRGCTTVSKTNPRL